MADLHHVLTLRYQKPHGAVKKLPATRKAIFHGSAKKRLNNKAQHGHGIATKQKADIDMVEDDDN